MSRDNGSAVSKRRAQIQQSRTQSILREARFGKSRQDARHAHWQRTAGNTGLHSTLEPYAGPKTFEVYHPHVAAQLAAGVQLKGRPPVPFLVRRDEALMLPFGGFRVYWRDIEVGRQLSWPEYDACRRLREWRRYEATPEERKVLNAD